MSGRKKIMIIAQAASQLSSTPLWLGIVTALLTLGSLALQLGLAAKSRRDQQQDKLLADQNAMCEKLVKLVLEVVGIGELMCTNSQQFTTEKMDKLSRNMTAIELLFPTFYELSNIAGYKDDLWTMHQASRNYDEATDHGRDDIVPPTSVLDKYSAARSAKENTQSLFFDSLRTYLKNHHYSGADLLKPSKP
jgi:hypothetical protein